MRKIHWVVIHCSDSDLPHHDSIDVIKQWHTLPKIPVKISKGIADGTLPKSEAFKYGNGWKDVGYHYFIDKSGGLFVGRDEDIIGAHVSGHNAGSIGICLSGRKLFTEHQFLTLEKLMKDICKRHNLSKQDILGHCDLQPGKTCPNFDVHEVISKWSWH